MILAYSIDENARPWRAHPGDAGLDLRATSEGVLPPMAGATFGTGFHIRIPQGYAGFVMPRSGLNMHKGVFPPTGVVDAGYTGEVLVKLYNLGAKPILINRGDRIAQLVIVPINTDELHYVDSPAELGDTERGADGFGSTGKD